jgi:hypothetical protein
MPAHGAFNAGSYAARLLAAMCNHAAAWGMYLHTQTALHNFAHEAGAADKLALRCSGCRSVFVRNCQNCHLVCLTHQLRTRDCRDCSVLLRSRTRPIIESSTGIALGCYCTPYAGVAKQMAAVQLSPLHNFWSDVFDFTPAEGAAAGAAGGQGSKHWQLLPAGTSLQQHMGTLPEQVQQLLGQTPQEQPEVQQEEQSPEPQAALQQLTEQDRQAVVCTAGALCSLLDIPEGCFAFLLCPAGQQEAVLQWLAAQFPCPASSRTSSLAAMCRSKSESSGCGDAAGVTAVDDITVEERPAAKQSSGTVAGADTTNPVSAEVQQQQEQQPVLLRTNEAAVPAEVLQQIAAVADWSQAQLKQLSSSHTAAAKGQKQDKQRTCYTGVEVSCISTEQQAAVCSSAVPLGALVCSSLQAAKLFRHLGTDG